MKNRIAALLLLFALKSFGVADANAPVAATKFTPPPKDQKLRVEFVLTDEAVMIDFAGPWEVFQDVMVPNRSQKMEEQHPFELFVVSDSTKPIRASDGMQIVPNYTFDNAPKPDIIVVPAQDGRSPKMLDWLRRMKSEGAVVMSVCTGAFVLADAGMLDGKPVTTFHEALDILQREHPKIQVQRGMRYVQSDPRMFTAAGLSSGIDLALHIVELYFGREIAQATADMMEYEGTGWKSARKGGGSGRGGSAGKPGSWY